MTPRAIELVQNIRAAIDAGKNNRIVGMMIDYIGEREPILAEELEQMLVTLSLTGTWRPHTIGPVIIEMDSSGARIAKTRKETTTP
jgi:hypothetical protein